MRQYIPAPAVLLLSAAALIVGCSDPFDGVCEIRSASPSEPSNVFYSCLYANNFDDEPCGEMDPDYSDLPYYAERWHPQTTCQALGYTVPAEDNLPESGWYYADSTNHQTPGANGAWSGGSNGGGGNGGDVQWKEDTWRFVDSDKAVQSRLGLAQVEIPSPDDSTKDRYHLRIQYRVNSEDPIWRADHNGYHLFARGNGKYYRIEFPSSFHGLSRIYEPPVDLWIDLDGESFRWDSTQMRVVNAWGENEEFPWSCVDDNSIPGETRCTSFEEYGDYQELTAG